MVIEASGFLLKINKLWRTQHGGVGRDHRVGEVVSLLQRGLHHGQETLYLGAAHGTPIRLAHEILEQAFRVHHRLLRDHFHADGRSELAIPKPVRLRRPLLRLAIRHGQTAEEQLVSGGRPFIEDRPLDFHPAEDDAGLAVLFRERILPAARAGTGTEETSGIGPDHFAGEQMNIELMHARLGRDVEVAQMPEQARRRFGGDGDRLVAATLGNVVEIGNEPLVALARPGPNGIGVEAQLVAAGHRRLELVPLRLDRLVGAGHHAHAFEFALVAVRAGDGLFARTNIRLTLETKHRKCRALRRGVEDGELHRAGKASLVASVVTRRPAGRAFRRWQHRLAQRVIRRAEIARHLHMRDIERGTDLVEAVRLAIFRK